MNTVTASFNKTVRRMTDMTQQKNDRHDSAKNDRNVSAKKKQAPTILNTNLHVKPSMKICARVSSFVAFERRQNLPYKRYRWHCIQTIFMIFFKKSTKKRVKNADVIRQRINKNLGHLTSCTSSWSHRLKKCSKHLSKRGIPLPSTIFL